MASYTPVSAKHATTGAAVVDTITFSRSGSVQLLVMNRDTADVLYFTIDGSTPVSGADDTWVVPPGQTVGIQANVPVVKVISAGACDYSVMAA